MKTPCRTVNPYRHALGLVASRLAWDLNYRSWESRARIRLWRNRFPGGRAVIVCNGPSLKRVDLQSLSGLFTFGLNKINLLFDRTPWRPSCIVAVNTFVIQQNQEFYNSTDIPLFLGSTNCRDVSFKRNTIFLHPTCHPRLAEDCSMSLNIGATVTSVALQLAFHMGFRHIGIVGCDHSFAAKGVANSVVTANEVDQSHFDSRYFSGGVSWQLPDLAGSEFAYSMAQEMFKAGGGSIANCTAGDLSKNPTE